MKRRQFIAGLGSAAAWPLAAWAKQAAVPVVGHLISSTSEALRTPIAAFHRGLADAGYFEDRNVVFEYLAAEDHLERLPGLADELVRRRVAVIATMINSPAALAAKAATQSIPIVFVIGADPVAMGLVANLTRPGGNVTGFTNLANELVPKRLALVHELLPSATVGLLVNPNNPANAQSVLGEPAQAARSLGIRLLILNASNPNDIERAFETLVAQHAGAVLFAPESLFIAQRDQLVALAARYRIPAVHMREAVAAGGLIAYEGDLPAAHRLAGGYVGRILNGEKPGDLPVQQSAKFTLSINLKTAKALGIDVPPTLLALADEVIE